MRLKRLSNPFQMAMITRRRLVAAVYEVNLRTDRACFIVEAHGLGDRVDYLDGPLLTPLRSWVPTARIRDSAPNGVKTSRASQVGESIQPRR